MKGSPPLEDLVAQHVRTRGNRLHGGAAISHVGEVVSALETEDASQQDEAGNTPLIVASMSRSKSKSHLDIVRMLWEASGEEGRAKRGQKGRTALHWLVTRLRGQDSVRFLIDHMSDVSSEDMEVADWNGDTVLHCLAHLPARRLMRSSKDNDPATEGVAALVNALLEKASPSVMTMRNAKGLTPLHTAARRGNRVVLLEMVKRATLDQLLTLDNKGHSFAYHMCTRSPRRTVWEIAGTLREEFLTRMPVDEIGLRWEGRDNWASPETFFAYFPPSIADTLLARGPLEDDVWVSAIMWNTLEKREYRLLLKLLKLTNMKERLREENPSHIAFKYVNPVSRFSYIRTPLSEEEFAIVREILEVFPPSFFARRTFPVLSSAQHSNFPPLLELLVEMTDFSMWDERTFDNLVRYAKFENLIIVISRMPRQYRTAEMLKAICVGLTVEVGGLEILLQEFDDEAVLYTDAAGRTLLHHIASRPRSYRGELIGVVLMRAPQLRSQRDKNGRTPLDIVRVFKSPSYWSDSSIERLSPMVKGAS